MDFFLAPLLFLVFLVAPLVLAVVAWVQARQADAQARRAEALALHLRRQLLELERRLGGEGAPLTPPVDVPVAAAQPAEAEVTPVAEAPTPPSRPAPEAPLASATMDSAPAEERSGPDVITWLVRLFSSGANLAGLGAGLILAGVAFFLEYGTQTGLLPQGTRLGAALVVGVLMVAAGLMLRGRRPQIGLALQGGGLGVTYTAIYAGHNLLHLLPAVPSFVALALLSFAAVGLAFVNDSKALAFLALIGGLAAPALASSSGANLSALFGYYLVLNLTVLALSILKGWRSVHAAAFILTFVTGGLIGGLNYSDRALGTAEPFLILFFAIYFASTLALAYRYPERPLPLGHTVTLPVMTLLLQAGVLDDFQMGLGVSAAALAAVYLGAAWRLRRSRIRGWAELAAVFTPIGVGLLAAVFPLLLEPDLTGVAWALQGATLLWLARRHARRWIQVFGLVLLTLAGMSVVVSVSWFGAIVWGLSVVVAAYALRGRPEEGLALILGGTALVLGAVLTAEEFLSARLAAGGALALGGLLLAGVYSAGRRLGWYAARRYAALLAGLALAIYPFLNGLTRAPLFGLAGAGYLVGMLLLLLTQRDAEAEPGHRRFPALVLAWAPTFAVALSLYHLVEGPKWSEPFWTLALMAPLGLLGWLAASPTGRSHIWRLKPEVFARDVRTPVVAVLAVVTLLVCFGEPLRGGLWHLPVLNPADLAVLIGLTVLARHWRTTRRSLEDRRLWGLVALGVLGVTTAMARVAGAHFGLPFTLEAALSSTGLQTAVSLLWSALALLLLAFSRRRHSLLAWRIALGLLGLTTVKLLLVDLAAAGTVARIISFMGVGALFVTVAFLLPAPKAGGESAD